jgi:MOSC domain-containing protein YiiM
VRVVREGEIESGDAIRVLERAADSITVRDIFALKFGDDEAERELRRAAGAPGLSPSWKDDFLKRLGNGPQR